jgi:hypothetical protein
MAEHDISMPFIHRLVIGDDREPVLSKFHTIALRYIITLLKKIKGKRSRYRPRVAPRVPGS